MSAQALRARLLVAIGYVLIGGALVAMCVGAAHAASGADRARLGSTIIPNGSVVPEYSSGSVTFREGNGNVTRIGHTWDAQPSRQTRLNENYRVQVGGQQIDWTRRSLVPPGSVMKAAAIAAKTLTPIAVGVELWDLFNEVRVRPGTCAEGGLPSSVSDLLCFDAGVPQENVPGTAYCFTGGSLSGQCFASVSEAAHAQRAVFQAGVSNPKNCYYNGNDYPWSQTYTVDAVETTPVARFRLAWNTKNSQCVTVNTVGSWVSLNAVVSNVLQCPASIDFSNPANNIPEGLPPDADGKCLTGRYNTPMSPVDAAQRVEQYAPPDADALRRLAEDALERGATIPDVTPQNGTGPATKPGTPTTTTTEGGPNGSETTTKTPTVHYTYNGDTINYTVVTVTTVTNNNGTTTTTEGKTPEESDDCKTSPDSLGCSKMGDPGSDAPSWQTRDVVFAPEDLGFGAGSCPAPESWDVFGMTLTWGYERVCEVAPIIRLALLAFAAIGAIGVIIKETNS